MDGFINLLIVWFLVSIPASLIIGHLLSRRANPQSARQQNIIRALGLVLQRRFAQPSAPRLMPGKLIPNRLHLNF